MSCDGQRNTKGKKKNVHRWLNEYSFFPWENAAPKCAQYGQRLLRLTDKRGKGGVGKTFKREIDAKRQGGRVRRKDSRMTLNKL